MRKFFLAGRNVVVRCPGVSCESMEMSRSHIKTLGFKRRIRLHSEKCIAVLCKYCAPP